jgi:hypothetical protein
MPGSVLAQSTTPAAPRMQIADTCPIAVVTILALDGDDKRATTGRTFEAILSSPDGPGLASGSLWVNASGVPYHVSFERRHVLSNSLDGPIDPIVFHLPQNVNLENAFVDTLDNPSPGPCRITSAWTPMYTQRLKLALLGKFDVPATGDPIEARPISDPIAACHSPAFLPTTLSPKPVNAPALVGIKGDVVKVLITLAADSSIADSTIMSTTNRFLNASALDAVNGSMFRTEIFQCRPVTTKYIYEVDYSQF